MLKYLEKGGINDGFNSSHAYSVALDSLYGAYLKANYPLEYFSVVLNIYEDDTEMTAKLKQEMDEFGISVFPIRYGKSRSEYTPQPAENSIYKGIKSIKFLNQKIADELMELSKQSSHETFTELLIDIVEKSSVNSRQLDILIRLDFFSQFGNGERLLAIYDNFINGKKKYKKTYVQKTKDQRIPELIEWEIETDNKLDFPLYERIMFEKEVLGYSTVTKDVPSNEVVVTDIFSKFKNPIVTLYQVNKGKEIKAKVKANTFYSGQNGELLSIGDHIEVISTFQDYKWRRDSNGKFYQDKNEKELFISSVKHIK